MLLWHLIVSLNQTLLKYETIASVRMSKQKEEKTTILGWMFELNTITVKTVQLNILREQGSRLMMLLVQCYVFGWLQQEPYAQTIHKAHD